MKYFPLILAGLFLACQAPVTTPEALIGKMHDTYEATYLQTLTFTQRTVHTNTDGSKNEETWYESYRAPGNLSIRFGPAADGNGILFTSDSVFSFEGGIARAARPMVHSLLLLGFDVYAQSPAETVKKLTDLGYDMTVMDDGTWQDRPVYIVGAMAGNDTTKQFWIDKERLVFVRSIESRMRMMMEVQFNDYQQVDGSWIGAEVLFMRDGHLVTEEYYSDIKVNPDIDEREFEAMNWMYVAENEE